MIATLNEQVKVLQGQVEEHFGRHPDAEIYLSQPGMGAILGARVLAEFGDDPHRYAAGKARKNYAATSPITRASGKKKIVAARFIHNDRLVDALSAWAYCSMLALARRPRLLRRAARQGNRAQRRPQPAGQPARRHPARLPEDPHPLRRGNRLGPPEQAPAIARSRLTSKLLGCLSEGRSGVSRPFRGGPFLLP